MYIHHKLGLGFGGTVGLVLLLSMLAWQNMQILVNMERGQERVRQMREALLESRRHEKNFLLRQDEKWASLTREWMTRLGQMVRDEAALTSGSEHEAWHEISDITQSYLDRFEALGQLPDHSWEERVIQSERHLVPLARQLHERFDARLATRLGKQEKHLAYTERLHTVFVILAILGAGIMVIMLTRSILRSLKSGVQFSRQIASGNLTATIDHIPKDEIGILLHAMQQMGRELHRLDETNLRSQARRLALSALLESSLEPLSLQKQLEVALQIVLTVPFLRLEHRGAIFLADEQDGTLRMMASVGLTPQNERSCQTVRPGWCLCGRAALEKRLLHVQNADGQHENRYDGMADHGHYCLPIVSRGRVLAVMNLYLDPAHVKTAEEEAFLANVGFTLAGILERKRLEERMQHLAHHDILTSLPNRVLFAEHLTHALAQATRGQEPLALMLIDLDHFKEVNDTLGHAAGDQVLITSTQRIRDCLRASDLVARMGGDEFAVILSDLADPAAAGRVAGKIVQSVAQPIEVAGDQVVVGASIGIALFPTHGTDGDALMANADMAMYTVKERGRNGFRYFEKADRKNR
ncbi:MAG: diguanylate cyclase [Magnetococcales bacterium]|nr:diguanylate cyclase [Magnetococcales bacterium]